MNFFVIKGGQYKNYDFFHTAMVVNVVMEM
jgi:hypothetical protein